MTAFPMIIFSARTAKNSYIGRKQGKVFSLWSTNRKKKNMIFYCPAIFSAPTECIRRTLPIPGGKVSLSLTEKKARITTEPEVISHSVRTASVSLIRFKSAGSVFWWSMDRKERVTIRWKWQYYFQPGQQTSGLCGSIGPKAFCCHRWKDREQVRRHRYWFLGFQPGQ